MTTDTRFVRGADRLQRRIAAIRRSINLPEMTNEIGTLIYARTMRRFDREVDPDEKPWPELKEDTRKRKIREGLGVRKMLVASGDLRRSIKLIRGGLGTTFFNTGAGVRIGVEDKKVAQYARVHQQGLGEIPARRFLGIGRLDIKAVDSLLRRKARQIENAGV